MGKKRRKIPVGSAGRKNFSLSKFLAKVRPWLAKAALVFANTMAGLALFPFSWKTFFLDLLFIIPALYFAAIFFFKARSKQQQNKALRCGLLMSLCAFTCILLSPFLLNRGPVYVGKGTNPGLVGFPGYGSEMHTVEDAEGNHAGTFLWITDPVRKNIMPVLEKLSHGKIREFPTVRLSGYSYVILPVMTQTLIEQSEHGVSGTFNSLYFPMFTTETDLNINGGFESYNNPLYTLSYGVCLFSLIDFAYDQNPETIPWNAVRLGAEEDKETMLYATKLDIGLEDIAVGKTTAALSVLETAADNVPHSNLEAARVMTIEAFLTSFALRGDLGILQTFPALNKSYELFLTSTNDPRYSTSDPLCLWIEQTLQSEYDELSPLYADRADRLKRLGFEPDPYDVHSYFTSLETKLLAMGPNKIRNRIKSNGFTRVELLYLKSFITEQLFTGLFGNKPFHEQSELDLFNDSGRLKQAIADYTNALSLIEQYEPPKDRLRAEPDMRQWVLFYGSVLSFSKDRSFTNILDNWVPAGADALEMKRQLADFMNQAMAADLDSKAHPLLLTEPENCAWWEPKYACWFCVWSHGAIHEVRKRLALPILKSDMETTTFRKVIEKNDVNAFLKDTSKAQHTFIPGLYVYALYCRAVQSEDHVFYESQFQNRTGLTIDEYTRFLTSSDTPFKRHSIYFKNDFGIKN